MQASLLLCLTLSLVATTVARAHGGRTNAQGCHNDRVHGGDHCHGAPAAADPAHARSRSLVPPTVTAGYANCTAARAAGAAPVRRGDPGYAAHLDRDNDGVGCE